MIKDMGTGFEQSIPGLITDHLASVDGPIPAPLLATLNYLAGMSPSFSLRGGTREILRGIIARGMGFASYEALMAVLDAQVRDGSGPTAAVRTAVTS